MPSLEGGVLLSHGMKSLWDGMHVGVAIFGKYNLPHDVSGSLRSLLIS